MTIRPPIMIFLAYEFSKHHPNLFHRNDSVLDEPRMGAIEAMLKTIRQNRNHTKEF